MRLQKNNFYVVSFNSDTYRLGMRIDGEEVLISSGEFIFFNTDVDIDSNNVREATNLEKQYWFDSLDLIEKEGFSSDFSVISLSEFENWKKEKGHK